MILTIILTVVFGIVVVGLSIVYYVEQEEIKRIKRYNWMMNTGLRESARIAFRRSESWINFCG